MQDATLFGGDRPSLMPNYTPDRWGRMLLSGTQDERGVRYAYSTDDARQHTSSDRRILVFVIKEKTYR